MARTKGAESRWGPERYREAASVASVLSVVSTVLFVAAISLAGAGKTASITATSPLFAAPLAALFLKEPLSRRLALGTIVSAAGVWLLL